MKRLIITVTKSRNGEWRTGNAEWKTRIKK